MSGGPDPDRFDRAVVPKGNRMRDADLGGGKLTVYGTSRVIRPLGAVIESTALVPFAEARDEE